MDFALSKENIQPLRGGRNAAQLEVGLQAQHNPQYQQELLQQKQHYENVIRNYTGEDPLENYYQYIYWVEQSFPKNGHEGNLVNLLEDCLSHFENDPRYKNDIRYCKLWIKYIDMQQNHTELYQLLYAKKIGVGHADMYKAWAYYYEAAGDYKRADQVYKLGKEERAQPFQDMEDAHFHFIYNAGFQLLNDGADTKRLAEQRHALTKLQTYKSGQVGSMRFPSGSAGILQMPQGAHNNENAPNMAVNVFEDYNDIVLGGGVPSASILTAVKRDAPKENMMKAGVWTGGSKKAAPAIHKTSSIQIHEDAPVPPHIKGIQLPPGFFAQTKEDLSKWKPAICVADPDDDNKIAMYCKAQCYADPDTECSIEEVRARRYMRKMKRQLSIGSSMEMDHVSQRSSASMECVENCAMDDANNYLSQPSNSNAGMHPQVSIAPSASTSLDVHHHHPMHSYDSSSRSMHTSLQQQHHQQQQQHHQLLPPAATTGIVSPQHYMHTSPMQSHIPPNTSPYHQPDSMHHYNQSHVHMSMPHSHHSMNQPHTSPPAPPQPTNQHNPYAMQAGPAMHTHSPIQRNLPMHTTSPVRPLAPPYRHMSPYEHQQRQAMHPPMNHNPMQPPPPAQHMSPMQHDHAQNSYQQLQSPLAHTIVESSQFNESKTYTNLTSTHHSPPQASVTNLSYHHSMQQIPNDPPSRMMHDSKNLMWDSGWKEHDASGRQRAPPITVYESPQMHLAPASHDLQPKKASPQMSWDGIWQTDGISPPKPQTRAPFAVYEQSHVENWHAQQQHVEPKGNAMKTPIKMLNDDELAETGSRGGLDIAAAAQPSDGAKRLAPIFEDEDSIREPYMASFIGNTEVFNLNAMHVSTPDNNKRQQLGSIPNPTELASSKKRLFSEHALSAIIEEGSNFMSSGSGGSATALAQNVSRARPAMMEPINEQSSYHFNLSQNMRANAELRSKLGIDCESDSNSPQHVYDHQCPPLLQPHYDDTPVQHEPYPVLNVQPTDPFTQKVCEMFLRHVRFPGRHRRTFVPISGVPKICLKKDPCYVGGDRYIVDKHLGKGSYGNVYKAINCDTGSTVALKTQKPANKWEYYICCEIQARLADHPLKECFMSVHVAYFSDLASVLVSDVHCGSLLNLINVIKLNTLKNGPKHHLSIYLTGEMMKIVQAMHQIKIIHADIKPDNFLVMVKNDTLKLQLIDFGCSIDMSLMPEGTMFTRKVKTDSFQCCEMKDDRPWSYHTDLFCIAATAHVLLLDCYIELKKFDRWCITKKIPRYYRDDLWSEFFNNLLNMQDGLANLDYLIASFAEALDPKELRPAIMCVINTLRNR